MHQRKIPTIVGLLLVALMIFVFRFALDHVSPLLSKASETVEPKNVTITNISDTSFTVSWTTTTPATGAVQLGEKLTNSVFYDDRVSAMTSQPIENQRFSTHAITVRALKPETMYQFNILSAGKPYQNGNARYEVRTASIIAGLGTAIEPAYGQITTQSGDPADGALVYLTLTGGQTLSTLTKSGGTWVIPLHRARTSDLTTYSPSQERIDETILIRSQDQEAHVMTDTMNDNPVPVITLGKTYDFRKVQADGNTKQLAETPPRVLGTTTETSGHSVTITKPNNGAALTSNLPLIQGTGVPNNQVLITIGITHPLSDTFLVGTDGIWRYTPPKPLNPGKQSVTITTKNSIGKTVAITHIFEILKSGTQVLGEATPSASLTPDPTIPDDPTPTATIAGEPIPETGSSLPLISMLILGIGLIGSGLVNAYARRYS